MKVTHDLVQGSPAWDEYRLAHFGASEAAAMLGLSRTVKRSELLLMKKTGSAKEFSAWVQRHVLDKGHEVEAMARPHVEAIVGDELYPCTVSNGRLSASCDGLTLDNRTAFEHKQWQEAYAAQVAAGVVPEEHVPQCQQVLMLTEAERLIFVISDGTPERMVSVMVAPDPEWFARIRAGWAQFEADLDAFVPEPVTIDPIAAVIESLPALSATVEGRVIESNLAPFRLAASTFLAGIKTDLATDQDFVDADRVVKFCADGEDRLELVKAQALSQTASIDELFRTIDAISAEMRAKRLALSKLIDARKLAIRAEIVSEAQAALDAHHRALLERLGRPWLARVVGPFAEAMKGKRTVASCRDAAATALANAKIDLSARADLLELNWKALTIDGVDWAFLFADFAHVGQAPTETFRAVAAQRIRQHEEAEAARKAALAAVAAPVAAPAPTPAPSPVAVTRRPQPTAELPTLNAGHIARRLGFTLTVDFICEALDVHPAPSARKNVHLWTETQFTTICERLVAHVQAAAAVEVATA